METLLIVTIVIIVIGFAASLYFLTRKPEPKEDSQSFMLLQEQLSQLRETVDSKLSESSRMMQDQFGQSTKFIQGISSQSNKMISDITEKLTTLDKTNQQVVGFTEQLQTLEKVLTNSKTRGALGESNLEMILSNILPPQTYEMQYHFQNGEAVDAVIKIKDKILPVDAKFSLTNYQRIIEEDNPDRKLILEKEFKNDLKKRIDETAKYIRPSENTLEFAFMFIPAEGIYYDLLINEVGTVKVNTRSLIDYAFNEKKVILVSPTTFAAYLQTVLQGLRALQIEESAKEILTNVEKLSKHLGAYGEFHEKIGNQLGTVVNSYNQSCKEFKKIDKDILRIEGTSNNYETELLSKPQTED